MSLDNVHSLAIAALQPNPFQPRTNLVKEDLEELVESIKQFGVLEPLVVAQTPAGYQIIAGERRWRAALAAGLEDVPVVVHKTTPRGMLEMALVENVQRVDLNGLERAQAFQQLIREFGFSAEQIAKKISKSESYISNTTRLLRLPDAVKDGLLGGLISEGHARAILSILSEKSQIEAYKIILKESASVRRAEELARRYKENDGQVVNLQGRPMQVSDEAVKAWESQFQAFLHTKTKLKLARSRTHTRVTITLMGTPERTQADLDRLMHMTTDLKAD